MRLLNEAREVGHHQHTGPENRDNQHKLEVQGVLASDAEGSSHRKQQRTQERAYYDRSVDTLLLLPSLSQGALKGTDLRRQRERERERQRETLRERERERERQRAPKTQLTERAQNAADCRHR